MRESQTPFESLHQVTVYHRLLDLCGGIPKSPAAQKRSNIYDSANGTIMAIHSHNRFTIDQNRLDYLHDLRYHDDTFEPLQLEAIQPIDVYGKHLTNSPIIALEAKISRQMPIHPDFVIPEALTPVKRVITLYRDCTGGYEQWEVTIPLNEDVVQTRIVTRPYHTELPKNFWGKVLKSAMYL